MIPDVVKTLSVAQASKIIDLLAQNNWNMNDVIKKELEKRGFQ